jgi:hypothetical protein
MTASSHSAPKPPRSWTRLNTCLFRQTPLSRQNRVYLSHAVPDAHLNRCEERGGAGLSECVQMSTKKDCGPSGPLNWYFCDIRLGRTSCGLARDTA